MQTTIITDSLDDRLAKLSKPERIAVSWGKSTPTLIMPNKHAKQDSNGHGGTRNNTSQEINSTSSDSNDKNPATSSTDIDVSVADVLNTLEELDSDIDAIASNTNLTITETNGSGNSHVSLVAGNSLILKTGGGQTSSESKKSQDPSSEPPVVPARTKRGQKGKKVETTESQSPTRIQSQNQPTPVIEKSVTDSRHKKQNSKCSTETNLHPEPLPVDTTSTDVVELRSHGKHNIRSNNNSSSGRRHVSDIFPVVTDNAKRQSSSSSSSISQSSFSTKSSNVNSSNNNDHNNSETAHVGQHTQRQTLLQLQGPESHFPKTNNSTTDKDEDTMNAETKEKEDAEKEEEVAFCYNHGEVVAQRYCSDHSQAICLECAFDLHRTCREVEGLQAAAQSRALDLEHMCERMMVFKAEWESVLAEVAKVKTRLSDGKVKTLTDIKTKTEEAVRVIMEKEAELLAEAESLYDQEQKVNTDCEERVRNALTSLQQVQTQAEQVVTSGNQAALLRQFGKLKGRCEALADMEVMDSQEVFDSLELTSTWFDDVKSLPPAILALKKKSAVSKDKMKMSERGLETFKRISRKKRQRVSQDTFMDEKLQAPVGRRVFGARDTRNSVAPSVCSTSSFPSNISAVLRSSTSTSGLEGPQSIFEFFAGLESDKYPFGVGDICVMQPRLVILVTYLTSDVVRVFPWRGQDASFTSEPLGCTLCCMTQLTTETVAVTSSNSDQLSIMKVEKDSISLTHSISMKRQYRAVTALDYRTVALATDSKKLSTNVIVIVRFDSSKFKSFTLLKTINARQGGVPVISLLSKTVFKVPFSLCTASNGDIVVSDSENKALLALGQNGEKRFMFQPPKHAKVIDSPGGVASSPAGFFYLVDSCEQRILRFDREGKLRKMVLSQEDGLEWPIGVACVDDNTLCVAEFYGQVKVFRLK